MADFAKKTKIQNKTNKKTSSKAFKYLISPNLNILCYMIETFGKNDIIVEFSTEVFSNVNKLSEVLKIRYYITLEWPNDA